jgi:hypothetical protein
MGEHWLASFALLARIPMAETRRGRPSALRAVLWLAAASYALGLALGLTILKHP